MRRAPPRRSRPPVSIATRSSSRCITSRTPSMPPPPLTLLCRRAGGCFWTQPTLRASIFRASRHTLKMTDWAETQLWLQQPCLPPHSSAPQLDRICGISRRIFPEEHNKTPTQ
uniref:Uncharacterized protein n=1 Tax=Lygus hesperus TaxID=30085 RepID=A0A146M4K4_LYGHE